ncbi:MAG: tetratricopeptide repeat protein [Gemmataceae bacterium]
MSKMLHLMDDSWATVQALVAAGRIATARTRLQHYLTFPQLPLERQLAARRLLAELALRAQDYRLARQQLRICRGVQTHDASLWTLLGQAWEDDPYGSDDNAYRAYRRAVALAPADAKVLAALARAAGRIGKAAMARKHLKTLLTLAPTDETTLRVIVEACRDAKRPQWAQRLVRMAQFTNPGSVPLRQLLERVEFDCAQLGQSPRSSGTVLPFIRVIQADGASRLLRWDTGASATHTARPHLRLRG